MLFKKGAGSTKLFLSLILVFLTGCSVAPKSPISLFGPWVKSSSSVHQTYRGVFHIHTRYSHDSSGSISSILETARSNKLDFVVITDHNTAQAKDDHALLAHSGSPLLIVGNELSTTDGHLIALGTEQIFESPINPQAAIDTIKKSGGFSVLAHPVCEKSYWKDWSVRNFDAMEVYNHACDFYDANKIGFAMKTILFSPSLFSKFIVREPREALEMWDALMTERGRIISGIGALDAHVRYRVLGFPMMRYSNAFPIVTLYVSADSLSENEILKSLALGNSYFAFESYGHADGFQFQARSASQIYQMGSTAKSETPLMLAVRVPIPSEIRLMLNGKLLKKAEGSTLALDVKSSGIYRVEVFRNGKIWIVSNPIMVQA